MKGKINGKNNEYTKSDENRMNKNKTKIFLIVAFIAVCGFSVMITSVKADYPPPPPVRLRPTSYSITTGSYISGSLSNLYYDDGNDMDFAAGGNYWLREVEVKFEFTDVDVDEIHIQVTATRSSTWNTYVVGSNSTYETNFSGENSIEVDIYPEDDFEIDYIIIIAYRVLSLGFNVGVDECCVVTS